MAPPLVHMASILSEQLPNNPVTGNCVRLVYRGDAGTITAIQVGDLPRHTHETASEIFYVVEGSGANDGR